MDPNSNNEKRKSEEESDSSSAAKKICSDKSTAASQDLSSEVSTSNIEDLLASTASSSDLKSSSGLSECDKIDFLVQTTSNLENQSHNIGSTSTNLNDTDEVSLSDINIEPFISEPSEIEPSSSTIVDSNINVPTTDSSSLVTKCNSLSSDISNSQTTSSLVAFPGSSDLTSMLEKQCSEISGSDSSTTNEKNLASASEPQLVSSSNQMLNKEEVKSNVSELNILHSSEISCKVSSADKIHEPSQDVQIASSTSMEVKGLHPHVDSSSSLLDKPAKEKAEQIVCPDSTPQISDINQLSSFSNQDGNNESLMHAETKSLPEVPSLPMVEEKGEASLFMACNEGKNDCETTSSETMRSATNMSTAAEKMLSQEETLPCSDSLDGKVPLKTPCLESLDVGKIPGPSDDKNRETPSKENSSTCSKTSDIKKVNTLTTMSILERELMKTTSHEMPPKVTLSETMSSIPLKDKIPSVPLEVKLPCVSSSEIVPLVLEEEFPNISQENISLPTIPPEKIPSVSPEEILPSVFPEKILPSVSPEEILPSVCPEKILPSISTEEILPSVPFEKITSVLSDEILTSFHPEEKVGNIPPDEILQSGSSDEVKSQTPSPEEKSLLDEKLPTVAIKTKLPLLSHPDEKMPTVSFPEVKASNTSLPEDNSMDILQPEDKLLDTGFPIIESDLPDVLSFKENLPSISVTDNSLDEDLTRSSPPKQIPCETHDQQIGLSDLATIPLFNTDLGNVPVIDNSVPDDSEKLNSKENLLVNPISFSPVDQLLKPEESKEITDKVLGETSQDTTLPHSKSITDQESQLPKIDSSFASLTENIQAISSLPPDSENDADKKSEISGMEVDSTITPVEGSLVETPCDSGETSPCVSTPVDSCQVSAAPSPLQKDETNLASESLLYDESSMDTKDIGEECPVEETKTTKVSKKKKKKGALKSKGKTTPVLVDEETRMSANGVMDIAMDEDSQSSMGIGSKREIRRYRCEVIVPESTETFTADKLMEYLWPLDGMGEHYFIQEHIAQYLHVMSFKRKYPDLRRRPIDGQEKDYLRELGLVSEIACDLGLTAVRSEDVLDVMFNDFPSKYEEVQRVLRERKEKLLKEKGKVDYQVVNLDKSKMQEYSRKAALSASKWNACFNRERNEERRYSFDLQTFTLHMPVSRCVKITTCSAKMGSYPVAVLPGQYTDYCKRYTASELRGMPLQTVLSGPFTAEELALEAQGIESDDESAIASLGTCPEKEEPDTVPVIDPLSAEKQPRCKVCSGGRTRNKEGKAEPLIICGTCRTASHPTCIDLTLGMIGKIESYSWQCMDCKTCAQCNDPDDEERMIFCDMCDRGYHIYCVGLRKVPNGRWHCKECAICFTCGSKNPSGNEHIKNAEWQHEFKKDKDHKQLRYVCTLCVPCDKYWKRRQFCSVCMKVYRSIPEDGMVRCSGCPKYVHREGCSLVHENERFCNNCFKSRNKTALNHSRIIAAAKKKMATGNIMWK